MKSERLLAILLELQHAGKKPATELAAELEVSVRTIYRDIDALSAAGVAVYAERGSQGGIVLADSYRDALGRFDENELRALFVSTDDALAEIGLRGGRRSALDKLVRAMPARARETVREARGRVHVDSRRWAASDAPSAALETLREAVWSDRRVAIAYTDREGKVTRRTLDPLGLVTKAGVWYLIARDRDRDTIKTFRAQRIARVRLLAKTFVRPKDFDVGEYWNTSKSGAMTASEGPFVATFRMTRRALANASAYYAIESREREPGTSPPTWLVRLRFPALYLALVEALSWNEEAVAVEPPELCRRLAERGRYLVERYA